jgi:hypothetical protein
MGADLLLAIREVNEVTQLQGGTFSKAWGSMLCDLLEPASLLLPGPTSTFLLLLATQSIGFYHHPLASLQTRASLVLGLALCSESGLELIHQLLCISQRVFRH